MSSKARCCRYCVYANVLRDGTRTLAICANTPESPGQIVRIDPSGCCRNFRPRGQRKARTMPPEPPSDEIRYIPLTQGKYAIVDASDYEWLSRYQWYAAQTGCGLCYAATNVDGKTVFMHRLIMDAPRGKVVDHIDGNGLDDRRANLRLCTARENARNRRSRKGTTSQFLGVYRRTSVPDKWFARVACGDKRVYLGPFDDKVEAARARNRAAIELHGEFASLNFPEERDAPATDGPAAPPA